MSILSTQKIFSRPGSLHRLGALAALLAGAAFLLGGLWLALKSVQPGLPRFPENWLLVLLQLNLGRPGMGLDLLSRFNLTDLGFLFLAGLLQAGLYPALKRASRAWSVLALIQPFLGMLLFCLTAQIGRSSVMGAMLVASILMLRSRSFSIPTGVVGVAAAVLLLIGDFGTSAVSNPWLAASIAVGYILNLLWLGLVGRRLWQLGAREAS